MHVQVCTIYTVLKNSINFDARWCICTVPTGFQSVNNVLVMLSLAFLYYSLYQFVIILTAYHDSHVLLLYARHTQKSSTRICIWTIIISFIYKQLFTVS